MTERSMQEAKYTQYNPDPDESHEKVLALVGPGTRVVEIGCATGYLTERLEARGCEVLAVEPNAAAAAVASGRCRQVHCGYVEDIVSEGTLGYFDSALLVDVLEHVVDRDAFMTTVMTLLRPEGRVIMSLPNIAHWTARWEVLRGRFPYRSHGLFDDTHVRFYTRASLTSFLAAHGLVVVSWGQTLGLHEYRPVPPRVERVIAASWYRRKLLRWSARWWPELYAYQFVVVAARSAGGER
ncbi:MAG: class I SAM-dependent methyltransferase [Acidobacteria bacterium]|nr:class I SAM-dependent methyltransferase [Acidobacteriota bacterium]